MLLLKAEKLRILQSEVQIGDPHVSSDNRNNLSIIFSVFEPLINYGDHGGFSPALAERWEVSPDARTWVFHLRHPVSLHNGDLLRAQDVVDSLERVRDPNMGGELGSQGVYQSYLEGATIETLGDRAVRIVSVEPFADLLDLLVLFPIVPSEAIEEITSTPWGSGPFRLAEAEPNLVVMDTFRDYWRGCPQVKEIHWTAEPSAERRAEALLQCKADIVADLTPVGARRVETSGKARISKLESSVCTIFMCNLLSGICTDRRVRQALNYALDVSSLIETIMDGAATPLNGPLTPLHFGRDPLVPSYSHSPEKALELLREAGCEKGLDIVLDIPAILPDEAPRLAELMAEQYEKVNIHTTIREFKDRPKYATMVRAKQIDDACCFDSSPLSTYRLFREKFHSGAHGPWWQGYTNQQVNVLIDRAQATIDDARRQELYYRAYRIIHDDAPWIFLYNPVISWGMGPKAYAWAPKIDGLISVV